MRRGDLWSMNQRGGNQIRLTKTKARETAPTVAPGGKRIAFTRMRGEYRGAVLTMRMDGTGLKRLTGFHNANVGPSFSPDGKKILYNWASGEDIGQVRVMNRNGTGKKRLSGTKDNFSAVWAGSGNRIAYFNRLGRRPGLYVMKASGSNKERILVGPLSSVDDWGLDGRILYTTADGHIGAINPNGSDNQLLTSGKRWNHSPSNSPDGTKIAFQSCRGSNCRFFLIQEGSKRKLSGITRPSDGPTWSPDGRRIVVPFYRATGKRWDLKLLETDGSSAWLTRRGGIREGAAWQSR
ncbi:MAG: TolB family protein [Actinomycetota bacterium]